MMITSEEFIRNEKAAMQPMQGAMPAQNKPTLGLSPEEWDAVWEYIQKLG